MQGRCVVVREQGLPPLCRKAQSQEMQVQGMQSYTADRGVAESCSA